MQISADYSLDDYTRMLTIGRWAFGLLTLCTIAAGAFTQWVSVRIMATQSEEAAKMREHLLASQGELRRITHHNSDIGDALENLTVPRRLSEVQSATLRRSLQNGPRGKVIVTFLSVEWDAETYARQIAQVLVAAGFEVTVSEHLWVHLDNDGVFLCTRQTDELPSGSSSANIERCFTIAGIGLSPVVKSPEIRDAVAAPEETAVLVISNRK